MRRIVIATGGFDPIHSGHIDYLIAAARLGDTLVVGVNSDPWLIRKKGKAFMPFAERIAVVNMLRCVDYAWGFNDNDGSAMEMIRSVREEWPKADLIFANGGDRTQENIPEMRYSDLRLSFAFGVGGDFKKNSSSAILKAWQDD
jgi:cytidyltransferase-like protein